MTGDHSTPWRRGDHSCDAVPFVVGGDNVPADGVRRFSELDAARGSLGRFAGAELIRLLARVAAPRPTINAKPAARRDLESLLSGQRDCVVAEWVVTGAELAQVPGLVAFEVSLGVICIASREALRRRIECGVPPRVVNVAGEPTMLSDADSVALPEFATLRSQLAGMLEQCRAGDVHETGWEDWCGPASIAWLAGYACAYDPAGVSGHGLRQGAVLDVVRVYAAEETPLFSYSYPTAFRDSFPGLHSFHAPLTVQIEESKHVPIIML